MAQPYVGEIRMFGGNFAPAGWMFCEGQLLPISENETLFNLFSTTYGGGQQTFSPPDLRGRVPIHQCNGFVLAQQGGQETVTLNTNQMPTHTHTPRASSAVGSVNPAGNYWANSTTGKPYSAAPPAVQMNAGTITTVGGSQPHNNMMPYLTLNFCIAMQGVFPPRT